MRMFALFTLLAAAAAAPAQEGLKPETMAALKAGSVYIRTQIEPRKFTGSGFVVASDANGLLVATNAHVVALDEYAKLPAGEALAKLKAAKLTVLFGSGGPVEQSAAAEIVAYDPTVDLALLRVKAADVKDPPKPLRLETEKAPSETATVYTLGYPFGDALATGKGPAVTVGKASVSSLRTDDAGKLSAIQIDGNLNPGNSGGPMVNADGGVVGVAVAVLRDSQGIGFAVPVAEVKALLAGKATLFRADFKKDGDGLKATVEALVANPEGTVTGLEVDYAVLAADAARPAADADVKKLPGAKTAALMIDGAVAKGEFALDVAAGQLVYAVRPVGPAVAAAAPPAVVSLARAARANAAIDPDAKPPAGWKEVGTSDKYLTIWVPEKTGKTGENSHTSTSAGLRLSSTTLAAQGDNGVSYRLERATIVLTGPGSAGSKLNVKVVRDSLAQSIASDLKGKVTEETDAKLGTWPCKEYVIKGTGPAAVVRIVVMTKTIYLVQARGPEAKVLGDDGALFLNSFRFHPKEKPDAVAGGTVPTPGATDKPTPGGTDKPAAPAGAGGHNKVAITQAVARVNADGDSEILGGGNDPVFRDYAPEGGGTLVGFEIGTSAGARATVTGIKPLYSTKDGEKEGETHGRLDNAATVKAKEGYAVGGLVVCKGLHVDGLSVVFMKVLPSGKLDPKDVYESDWFGTPTKRRDVLVTGNGVPILGVIGRSVSRGEKHLTGLGLIVGTPDAVKFRRVAALGTATEIRGGGHDEFKDVAPENALLVGFDVTLGRFVNNATVVGVKPIYRTVGDAKATASMGKARGPMAATPAKLVAKAGYAVGAITLKTGLGIDGFSVTFMKVKADGTLDKADAYESDWIGGKGGGAPEKLGGDGTPIIGVVGRTNTKELTALGLLKK